MPLASMSNVTSICGMPRGDGGMPIRSNWPSTLLSAAISRSPWKTRMVTAFWLSSAVENTCDFLVGIVVLRSMMRVNTPPSVSMPSESGVTSSSSTSLTSPANTPAWMAAPMATTSSGLTPLCGSLPNSCFDFLHFRHARHAANQHDLVDLRGRDTGVLECLLAGLNRLLHEIVDQRLELGASKLHGQMLRTRSVRRDEWQIDLGLRRRRQFDLRFLGRFLEPLQRKLVAAQIDALFFLEFIGEIVHKPHVEVFTAQERIAV